MRGIVHEVKGDLAMVKIQRKEACGECRACFSGMMKTEMDIEAKNLCDAEEGDWVELELQENAFFNAVIVMYGLPFIGFIVGIVLGYFGVPKLIPNISPVFAFSGSGRAGYCSCNALDSQPESPLGKRQISPSGNKDCGGR